ELSATLASTLGAGGAIFTPPTVAGGSANAHIGTLVFHGHANFARCHHARVHDARGCLILYWNVLAAATVRERGAGHFHGKNLGFGADDHGIAAADDQRRFDLLRKYRPAGSDGAFYPHADCIVEGRKVSASDLADIERAECDIV